MPRLSGSPMTLRASVSLWPIFLILARRVASAWLAVALLLSPSSAHAQKFRPDDPILEDHDRQNIPAPSRYTIADYYDFLENTFFSPGEKTRKRAVNINTLGEVPDSSWFTNRHGKKPLSLEELVRGPDHGGPSSNGNWQVIQNKQGGITPGFRAKDATGTIYQLEFDPITNSEMATSAEVICTKIFHAIGYYVAEVYIISFSRNQLEMAQNAQFEDLAGKRRPMKAKDVDQVLQKAHTGSDGRYRTIASKFLPGKPVGTYRYYGTRPDDPNDIFPHEHRRELRGLRVFSAWLNHDDSRSINSFDSLISENGRQYIRHYLFDFGSTLGSGTVFAQKPRAGNEYLWEPGPTFKSIFSLGLWVRPWVRVDYPHYPSLGNFEAEFFRPEKWKAEYPNPAFNNLMDEDAFWAAKLVMAFTDDQLRAIVKTGQLSDARAEAYLTDTLIKRRNKVGNFWLNQVNPLDQIRVEDSDLVFDNAAVRLLKGTAEAESYQVQWHRFDNRKETQEPAGAKLTARDKRLAIPSAAFEGAADGNAHYALAEITTHSVHHPKWARPLRVYLRKKGMEVSVVGIERE
ncbi:MAG: hypothetical protein L0338_33660 [Acidobacteria bacterium]|nr:hypothetical protein [Acidobacteriota bacterium]